MEQKVLEPASICQVAIIVNDIEATARAWAATLGMEVPRIQTTPTADLTKIQYRGQTTPGRGAKLAFFNLGPITLELIEPIDRPSTWGEQLDAHGHSVHHIAFKVGDIKAAIAGLSQQGGELVQKGEFSGGRYAYVDTTQSHGATLELLEFDKKS